MAISVRGYYPEMKVGQRVRISLPRGPRIEGIIDSVQWTFLVDEAGGYYVLSQSPQGSRRLAQYVWAIEFTDDQGLPHYWKEQDGGRVDLFWGECFAPHWRSVPTPQEYIAVLQASGQELE